MTSLRHVSSASWSAAALAFAACALVATPAAAGPITFGDWFEFGFTNPGVGAVGCVPDDPLGEFCTPSSGTPTLFLDAPAWTFAAPVGVTLTVTDAFLSGDQFEILDFGAPIGMTSFPAPAGAIDCGDDPVPCLATIGMSQRSFDLAAGPHSLTIAPLLSPDGGGSGYLIVNTAVPEPATLLLLASGLGVAFRRSRARR